MNSIKSVSPAVGQWIGASVASVPHRELGWLRRKLALKMTAWKDGFEVFDGPNNFGWLGHQWLTQFGVVEGVICKVGLTISCGKEQSRILQDIIPELENTLGKADRNFSRPDEGALLWQGNDGTVILQVPSGLVILYFTSLVAINAALHVQ